MKSARGNGAFSEVPRGIHEVPAGAVPTSGNPSLVSNPKSLTSPEWQRYADIIDLAPHEPRSHPRMTRHDRAAQFAPYAPLTSFGKVLTDAALNGDLPGDAAPESVPPSTTSHLAPPQSWE